MRRRHVLLRRCPRSSQTSGRAQRRASRRSALHAQPSALSPCHKCGTAGQIGRLPSGSARQGSPQAGEAGMSAGSGEYANGRLTGMGGALAPPRRGTLPAQAPDPLGCFRASRPRQLPAGAVRLPAIGVRGNDSPAEGIGGGPPPDFKLAAFAPETPIALPPGSTEAGRRPSDRR